MKTLAFRYGDRVMEFGSGALLMGVLNVTLDSFSDGGEHFATEAAVRHGCLLASQGAHFLDIGGESTRPGASAVSIRDEISRVVPVIERLRELVSIPLSIDTCKAPVASAAIRAGAEIVNDVTGLRGDSSMASVIGASGVGCILMHMRGTPRTMQSLADYTDVVEDVLSELGACLSSAVARSGLSEEHFMLDPGIGFAKRAEDNPVLIAQVSRFRTLGRPVLLGPSRKSFIGVLTGAEDPHDRVWGTAGAVAAGILCGADVVRVHDVAEMRDVVAVANAVRSACHPRENA